MSRSKILMSDSAAKWNLEGDPEPASGYYGLTTGKHTVSISVRDFVGRIYLMGTLENTTEEADRNNGWFPIYTTPVTSGTHSSSINLVGDGVTSVFDVGKSGETANAFVAIEGVQQVPFNDFTYNNGQLSFTDAPGYTDDINVRIFTPSFAKEGYVEPKFFQLAGDSTALTFEIRDPISGDIIPGETSDMFIAIDGVQQEPYTDFRYNSNQGLIAFNEAPPYTVVNNISVSFYPRTAVKFQDYWMEMPVNPGQTDTGLPYTTDPKYGPRTTGTVAGVFTGNYTFIKAMLSREYLTTPPDMTFNSIDLNAVGKVENILLNF